MGDRGSNKSDDNNNSGDKRKKESILDLTKFIDKPVRVKFNGGREVTGLLKGYDPLVNIVLDECVEFLRDVDDPTKLTDETRELGLVVCRGTAVTVVHPAEGFEEVDNPFEAPAEPVI